MRFIRKMICIKRLKFTILFVVANIESSVFKSEFFRRLEILDLSNNPFSFLFVSSILFVNLS